jgi:hypothetical protein
MVSRRLEIATGAARYLGAAALLGVGAVHAQQYYDDYFYVVPTIGTLFLLNFIGAGIVGAVLIAPVRRLGGRFGDMILALAALAAIGIAGGSLVSLLVSEYVPLFGFMESGYRLAIVLSLLTDALTILFLGAFIGLLWVTRRTPPGGPRNRAAGAQMRRRQMRRTAGSITMTLVATLAVAAAAFGDSTPIGALPAGPVATIQAQRGELVALALPKRSGGRVWRIARPFKPTVLSQVSEADVGPSVVVVFRARRAGAMRVSFALTASDASSKALESRQFVVNIK